MKRKDVSDAEELRNYVSFGIRSKVQPFALLFSRRENGGHEGSPSELLEDAAETLDLLLDSQRAHRLPVRAGVDREHGLAELPLQLRARRDRGEVRPDLVVTAAQSTK